MTHIVRDVPSGAVCSCGREFNVWAWKKRSGDTSNDIANRVPLARANAHRHADAANRKDAAAGECDCMKEDTPEGERVLTHSMTCPEHPEYDPEYDPERT